MTGTPSCCQRFGTTVRWIQALVIVILVMVVVSAFTVQWNRALLQRLDVVHRECGGEGQR